MEGGQMAGYAGAMLIMGLIFIFGFIFFIGLSIYITKRVFNYINLKTLVSSTKYGEFIKISVFPLLILFVSLTIVYILRFGDDISKLASFEYINYAVTCFFVALIITTCISLFKYHKTNKMILLGLILISGSIVFILQFKLPQFIEITNSPFLITISKESDHKKIIKYLVETKKDFTFCDDFQYSQPCYKLMTDSIDVIAGQLIEKEKNSIINCDSLAIEFQEKELLHTNGIIDIFKKLCSDSHLIQEAIETKDVNKCAGISIIYNGNIYDNPAYARCVGYFTGTQLWEEACKKYSEKYSLYKYDRSLILENYINPARCNK